MTRSRINDIPYATMAAKLGSGSRSLVVLGRVDGADLHWISADRTVLVTRRGRLIRTAGLPFNLRHTELLAADPLSVGRPEASKVETFKRLVDLTPPDRYGVVITSTLEHLGPREIEIAELRFRTEAYRESCEARDFDWSFENLYWVGRGDGLVWKSVQHIHPSLPPVDLEILKPPAV